MWFLVQALWCMKNVQLLKPRFYTLEQKLVIIKKKKKKKKKKIFFFFFF